MLNTKYFMLFAFLAVMTAIFSSCANSDKAKSHAQDWAKDFYPKDPLRTVSCEVSDSDGDGRVRCTLGFISGAVEFLDCPSDWTPQPLTTMCVLPKSSSRWKR